MRPRHTPQRPVRSRYYATGDMAERHGPSHASGTADLAYAVMVDGNPSRWGYVEVWTRAGHRDARLWGPGGIVLAEGVVDVARATGMP